jgi:excisionase family DNA binding protein
MEQGMDVQVDTTEGITYLISPYNTDVPPRAKEIGGRWDPDRKAWRFDSRDEDRVRALAREIFGTDGRPADGDLVTVRVRLADFEGTKWDNAAQFAGRKVAERPGRDSPVRLAANIVLVEGSLRGGGGSMRYPLIDADDSVIVEIRDLPRAALDVEKPGTYTIVGEQIDTAALLAEREQLLSRVAEIDALLPEPEGAEVSTRQAAAALGVSVRTVQRWAATGKVEAAKDGQGRWIITIIVNDTADTGTVDTDIEE